MSIWPFTLIPRTLRRSGRVFRKGVKLIIRVANGARNNGHSIKVCDMSKEDSDGTLADLIRHHPRTTYHYSSTCWMASASLGVVDDEPRMHRFDNLSVVGCSVFPDILAAHLQVPAAIAGAKCVDMIHKR
jgi:choline dehydrogenase